jgi:hypothetical protein
VKDQVIPTNPSGLRVALAQPEGFLVALFVLSPALWLVVFLGCYLSARISLAFSAIIRTMKYRNTSELGTLFPHGPPTSRPTLLG